MDFTYPIWQIEDRIFEVWNFVTGKDRPLLRKVVLILATITVCIGYTFVEVWLAYLFLVIYLLTIMSKLYSDRGAIPDGYKHPSLVRVSTFDIYWALFLLLFHSPFWSTIAISRMMISLSDFILWADHIDKNNKKKRRETLPGKLAKMFAQFKPATDGV